MKRLSIVMVSAGFWPALGGAERQAFELSCALVRRGHRVTVLTRRVGGGLARESVSGVDVRRLPVCGGGALESFLFVLGALAWLLAHWTEWDAVHAHLAGSPALAAALSGRLLGRPALVKLGGGRGIGELATSSKTTWGRAKLRGLVLLRPRFIAVAEDLAAEAREFLGDVPIELLANGVDTALFSPVETEKRRNLRARLHWPADEVVFLYAGRFSPEKRLDWFLKSWLEAGNGRGFAVFVGEGSEGARIAAIAAASSDRVSILSVCGAQELADLYAAADVFVLPSTSEGLSNALLEAMSSGLAVLASRVGGTAEVVEDGRTGLLFARDDERALAAAVRRFLEDRGLAGRLGRGARAEVEKRYAIGRVVDRLEELYRGAESVKY